MLQVILILTFCIYAVQGFYKVGALRSVSNCAKISTNDISHQQRDTIFRLYAGPPPREDKGPPKKKALKDDVIQVNGRVIESLPNAMFRVEIEPSKNIVLVTISGKIRKNFVRIVVGDQVTCELSAYDLSRGRITYRMK